MFLLHYGVQIMQSVTQEKSNRIVEVMISSVKQAQKDGATTEDISAGLSVSVVKNAIY